MSVVLGEAVVKFGAETSGLTAGISTAKNALMGLAESGPLGLVAAGLAGVTIAAVGVGVTATKMAGDFQQATNLLITSAGEVPANIDLIRKGLLQMSVDTATSTDELTKGMFNVESAGFHGADALKVEKAAAEGAKVENADLAATTDVLTTAMHNYHEPASQAVDVMNSFRMAASIGKMRMDDLTGALTNVLPIASQAGVKLSDVEAALSTMSLAGDKGASAGTHLAQMFTYLEAPSTKSTKALKEVGLTTQQIADEMKVSLPGAVQMITDAVAKKFPEGSAKYIAAISAIVGGNKSMKAILELSGQSLKTFTDDAKQLGPTMTANSTAVDGWNVVQGNFNFKMEAAQNAVSALLITIGTGLLPKLGDIVSSVTPVITSFDNWVTTSGIVNTVMGDLQTGIADTVGFIQNMIATGSAVVQFFRDNEWAVGLLGVAIGGLGGVMALFVASSMADMILSMLEFGLSVATTAKGAVTGALSMVTTFSEMSGMIVASTTTAATSTLALIGPFLLVGAIVAAVGIGVVLAIQHWGEISTWFSGVWAATVSDFNSAVATMNSAIQGASNWWQQWNLPIMIVASALTAFFLPAMLIAGTQAVTSGAMIAGPFVGSMVMAGLAATNNALLITADFITSMIETGTQATVSGAIISYTFVAGMIAAGWQATVAAAKITYDFITSLIATGVAGWVAAGGLIPFVGGLIASGVQGVIAAGVMLTTVVPSLDAVGVAAYAALGPIGLVLGAIALTVTAFVAMKTQSDAMQLGVSGAFDTMGNKVERSTGRIMVSADQMKTNVSNSAKTMKQNVTDDMLNAMNATVVDSQTMSDTASKLWDKFKNNATASLQQLDSSTISYMNSIADYINHKSAEAAMLANENFAKIHFPNMSGSNVLHNLNDSSNFSGHASGIMNSPTTHVAMVGENGPELMVVPQGASIYPSGTGPSASLQGSSGGSGSSRQEIHVHLHLDGQELSYAMVDHMGNALVDRIRAEGPVAA